MAHAAPPTFRTCRAQNRWAASVAGTAALIAVVASFLPWYREGGSFGYHQTLNGWVTPHELYSISATVVCVTAALFVIAFATLVPSGDREARRFGLLGGVIGVGGGFGAALLVYHKYGMWPGFGVHRRYAFQVAAASAAILVVAAILLWTERGRAGRKT